MKQTKWLLCAVLPVFLLTGCNTVRGFGTDIMKIGTSIQNTADRVSHNRYTRQQQATHYNNTYSNNNYSNYNMTYDPYYNQNIPQPVYNNY